MAVSRKGNVITMTAAADAVTGKFMIAAAVLDHTVAANAVVQNTASEAMFTLRTTASILRDSMTWPEGIIVDGIKASTLSAGTLYIYLMQGS